MGSAVSMRWLEDEPVASELVDKVLWAATRASNPGNSQPWDFVVVRDEATRREVAGIISGRLAGMTGPDSPPLPDDPTQRRILLGVQYLVEHFGDAPVLLFVCGN